MCEGKETIQPQCSALVRFMTVFLDKKSFVARSFLSTFGGSHHFVINVTKWRVLTRFAEKKKIQLIKSEFSYKFTSIKLIELLPFVINKIKPDK